MAHGHLVRAAWRAERGSSRSMYEMHSSSPAYTRRRRRAVNVRDAQLVTGLHAAQRLHKRSVHANQRAKSSHIIACRLQHIGLA